ncbi:uncharacterized protein LOC124361044 [Homalodisca vitripennis]|uniref:uncharacterized protein LOC124361044 n=1 Tax=Homalodisca vitripennis TaxID=197043 RepID=UPI001EE9CFA2|nr:uncharacterized protein LOC124361044 [Homalodisca vitripennis]
MDLNTRKSAILTYTRSNAPITFNYQFDGDDLSRVNTFKDLGVMMNSTLSPWDHVVHVCNKANSLLGFLCRTSGDFRSPFTLATLFKSIVRPVLEYSSVVWCPYQLGHIALLERLQIRLLRLIGLRLGYQYLEKPVDALRPSLGLALLSTRRKIADVMLLHKIVNGAIDCPDLLTLLEFRAPRATRSQDMFCRRASPSLYIQHSAIPRLMREGNEFCRNVDFFGSSYQPFRRCLLKMMCSANP